MKSPMRVWKNALVTPSATYRVKKPRGCVPAACSSGLVRPSPSGSPARAVVTGARVHVEPERSLVASSSPSLSLSDPAFTAELKEKVVLRPCSVRDDPVRTMGPA